MEQNGKGGDYPTPVSPSSGHHPSQHFQPPVLSSSLPSRTPFNRALGSPLLSSSALLQPSPFSFPSCLPHFLQDPPSSCPPHPGFPSLSLQAPNPNTPRPGLGAGPAGLNSLTPQQYRSSCTGGCLRPVTDSCGANRGSFLSLLSFWGQAPGGSWPSVSVEQRSGVGPIF